MSNPVDEYLEFKKQSSIYGTAKGVAGGLWQGVKNVGAREIMNSAGKAVPISGAQYAGSQIAQGALGAMGASAVAATGIAAAKIYGAITKRQDFNEMISLNQDLKEYQKSNPELFNATYSSLRRVNPAYGSDPVIAGAHMRKMMENPDAAGLTLAGTFDRPKPPRSFF